MNEKETEKDKKEEKEWGCIEHGDREKDCCGVGMCVDSPLYFYFKTDKKEHHHV